MFHCLTLLSIIILVSYSSSAIINDLPVKDFTYIIWINSFVMSTPYMNYKVFNANI